MDVKPGYKQTEVGVIPQEWDECRLSSLLTSGPVNGYSGRSAKDARGTPTLALTATTSGLMMLNDQTVKRLEETIDPHADIFLKAGDVLVQRSNTLELVGTTAIFDGPADVFVYPDLMMRLRFRLPETAQWFWRYANSANGRRYFVSVAAGSTGTMPKISGDKLRRMPLPLPPPLEQRAIAETLSDVDALLGALDQLIAKKRDLKQAAMQQLVTGQTRLPGFAPAKLEYRQTEIGQLPQDWAVAKVKKVTRSHKQGFYTKNRYVETGVKLVRITDLMNPRIDYPAMPMLNISESDHELYRVGIGDFLFARSGAIGRYGIVYEDVDAVFGSYIVRFAFDPEQLSNEYFGFLYETQIVWKQLLSITQGSSNMNINAANIKSLRIPLPPIPEQTAIAEVLSDMDAELAALEQRRAKTRALKQGMMQELLTGRTRLV